MQGAGRARSSDVVEEQQQPADDRRVGEHGVAHDRLLERVVDLPEAVPTQYFSANGLNVLGVPPLLGRVFNETDGPAGEQPQQVVVLTYRFWQRHFGGRPEAVGQTLHLGGEPYTVIGVLPRQYFYTGPEILVPIHLTFDPNFAWSVQARLKRGVNPRMAEQRLQPLFDQFARDAPQRFPGRASPGSLRRAVARVHPPVYWSMPSRLVISLQVS